MDLLDLITSTFFILFRLTRSCALAAGHLAVYFIYLAAWPIAGIWSTLLFVLSPVTHTISFILSPFLWILTSFPRLQPLYIYFGSAAFIGLAVGLLFKLTSTSLLTILCLYDDPDDGSVSATATSKTKQPLRQPPSTNHIPFSSNKSDRFGYDDEDRDQDISTSSSRPIAHSSHFRAEQHELEMLLANLNSSGSDRGVGRDAALAALTGLGGWRDSPNIKRKRRSVGLGGGSLGLSGGVKGSSSASRFHTILEEEDDSM